MKDKKLQEALEAGIQGNTLQVEDIFERMKLDLDSNVVKAMKKRVYNTIALNEDMTVKYRVTFVGLKAHVPEIGIKKLAEIVNDIAKDHKILGSLASVQVPLINGSYMFFAYLAFGPDDFAKLVDSKWTVNEGDEPRLYLETPEDLEKISS